MLDRWKKSLKKILQGNFSRGQNAISYLEAKNRLNQNSQAILLDVRSLQEYEEYHLTGALCVPLYELQAKIQTIIEEKDRLIIVYCQTGHRSQKAIHILEKLGYTNLYQIDGGIDNL